MSLWRNLFQKARVERELDDELRSYLDMLTAEKIRAGMNPAAARRRALVESGGAEQVKEQVRDVRSGMFLDTLWRDLRYGVRTLARSRGFTITAVMALALGIGATTTIFCVLYALLLKPLPFRSGDRLMFVHMNFSPQNMPLGTLSLADYLDWKAANHVFEDMAVFHNNRFDLTGAGEPEQVDGVFVTAGFFSTLEVQPLVGRLFLPGEDGPGSQPLVVLSESLWRRRFGASLNAIGGPVELNGSRYTVIGVAPASFRLSSHPKELWANLPWKPPTRRGPFNLTGLARLRQGVTREQAQAETNAIGRRIEQANAGTYAHLTLPVVPMREAVSGDIRPGLLVMFGAVLLVLLIAIVNVANLLLARATTREREMAIRLSLGAGRLRLLRQLLTESVLLALAGGIAGLLLASWGIAALRWWGLDKFPRGVDVGIDGHVLLFTCLLSLAVGVLLGLAPAWTGARTSLNVSLREGGPASTTGRGNQRLRAALVVCEIALSLVLLVGAGLLLRSFLLFERVKPGFTAPPEHVLTMHISPNRVKYDDDEKAIAFHQRMLESLARLPGVDAVGISDSLPPDDVSDADTFVIEGQAFARGQMNPKVTNSPVSPGYFRALGIPLRRGRYFDERDTARSAPVVVISESLARRYLAGQDPIGKRLKPSGPELTNIPYSEIVGVVGDVIYCGVARGCEAAYYQPWWCARRGRRPACCLRCAAPYTR